MAKQKATESIRLVVEPKFKKFVQQKASDLGVNVTTYIKHLILVDMQLLPTFEASDRVKKIMSNLEKEKRHSSRGRDPIELLRSLSNDTG